jgi:hypothetical protein
MESFWQHSSNISAAISMIHHCEEEEGGCHLWNLMCTNSTGKTGDNTAETNISA